MDKIASANLEEATLRAIEVFEHPFCESESPCLPVDFTDAFKDNSAVSRDPEELRHLSLGLFWLLESLGFVRESVRSGDAGSRLTEDQKTRLLDDYFPRVVEEMKAGGVWGAVYGPLTQIGWGLDDGELAEIQMENIILGFTVYLQDGLYVGTDWGTVREKMGYPPLEEAEPTPPTPPPPPRGAQPRTEEFPLIIPPPPTPKPKNRPPQIKIVGPTSVPHGERVTLKVSVQEPDGDPVSYSWRQIGGNSVIAPGKTKGPSFQFVAPSPFVDYRTTPLAFEVKVIDQPKGDKEGGPLTVLARYSMDVQWTWAEKEMKELAEATGGKQRKMPRFDRPIMSDNSGRMLNEKPLLEVIKEALKIELAEKEPRKKSYQIMFVIDRSGSMEDDIKVVKKNVGEIIDFARRQLVPGGEVSIAIRYYVDDVYDDRGEMVPLNGMETIEKEIVEAKIGLNEILMRIGGREEYHWEAVMHAMDSNEPWAPPGSTDPVERVVVLITDEEDGGAGGFNIKEYVKEDAVEMARRKGIRFEHILLETRTSGAGYGCFAGEMLLQKNDGLLISFEELAALQKVGQALPELASFDEATRTVVYQHPTKLIPHPQWSSTMVYLNGLEVTANHPMLVEEGGKNVWMPAGEIEVGDCLVNPDGAVWIADSIQKEEGIFDVYDISFSAEKTGQHPTFLVSPDGLRWFVAHNKRF